MAEGCHERPAVKQITLMMMKHYVKTYWHYSSNVTILPFLNMTFINVHGKILSRKKLEKMPQSQNEWRRSRLNKTLL